MSYEVTPGSDYEFDDAGDDLASFLADKFQDALKLWRHHGARPHRGKGASYIKTVKSEEGTPLTRDTKRIVLKPAHPYDRPGTYAEVFAYGQVPEGSPDDYQLSGAFLCRFVTENIPSDYLLVDGRGAHNLSDISDPAAGSVDERDSLVAEVRAQEVLEQLVDFHLVASEE